MSDVEHETDVNLKGFRICVIYDCLFPLSRGGAERWYRCLVDRLVASGASVTYVTRRQWTTGAPEWSGVEVVAVSSDSDLYDTVGVRRARPALAFGAGTFRWMVRHRGSYDGVITASFPFFSLLASQGALVGSGTPIFVDYHEVWSGDYWRSYSGWAKGTVGSAIEELCIVLTRFAQVFTVESARRLRARRFRGDVMVLPGLLPGSRMMGVASAAVPEKPMVIFVGRHVKHKGVRLLPQIFAGARATLPDLTMTVVSDGPERASVEGDIAALGLSDAVTFTGDVSDEELGRLFARASCTVVPSLREGYGIVVAESASAGTPVVVADNPENLATGLVETGVNGFVVDPSVDGLSKGIVAVVAGGRALRESTVDWSIRYSPAHSVDRSAKKMAERVYGLTRT